MQFLPRGLLAEARRIRHLPENERFWGYIHWLQANRPTALRKYMWKHYEKAELCPYCGAHTKNWQEVFGEIHKCEVKGDIQSSNN